MAKLVNHDHLITFFFLLSTLLYTLCYAAASSSSSSPCLQQNEARPIFFFGDSNYDPGNNLYLDNALLPNSSLCPYGQSFFKYYTGRSSYGRIVPDFFAEYAEIPLLPPYLQPGYHRFSDGANFASGGAGTLLETNHGMVIPLKTQVEYFKKVERQLRKKHGDEEAKALISRAVYIMGIGTDDYIYPLATNSSFINLYAQQYVGMVIGNLTAAIKEVYDKGGRKFWIPYLAPLGCAPGYMLLTNTCWEEANDLTKLHNKELVKMFQTLQTQLKGFKYSTTDTYSFLLDVFTSPSKYGFKEGKRPCCSEGFLCEDPSEYVFFDAVHAAEPLVEEMTRMAWNGTRSQTWPYNLKELFYDDDSIASTHPSSNIYISAI